VRFVDAKGVVETSGKHCATTQVPSGRGIRPLWSRNIASVPQRVDFSANSSIYDHRHGAVISDELVQSLANRLPRGATIIDIGAGTGRVAVPLAIKGFRLIAVDPALSMLQTMLRKSNDALMLSVAAEGTCLPFRRNSTEAVVLARLLYLVEDWQALLREAQEVLRHGGILFHEWGNGDTDEAWVQVREKARSLFQEAGAAAPFHPGARSEADVDSCLRDLGFHRREQIEAGAGPAITLADFLNKIETGEFSYIWNVPKDVRDSCLPQLRCWCESKFDLYQSSPMPAALRWVVYEDAG
jgi:SAM-dependent methyltransferase